MLQARSEMPAAGARLWAPGMSPQAADAGSARAQEIARRRQEMLGMLHDLPESEYELSLTDLVENSGAGTGGEGAPAAPAPSEGKEEPAPGRSSSGRQAAAAVERPERRASSRRRDSGGGSSYRSSSDGVLLNFYMPRSLTRSFTAPRPGRTPSVSGGGRPASVSSDCNKRERDADADTAVRCWPLPWDRRWRKSGRRDPGAPPGESTIRAASAAIIKAANHSAAPAKI